MWQPSCQNWSKEKKNCGNGIAEIEEKREKKLICNNEVTENWKKKKCGNGNAENWRRGRKIGNHVFPTKKNYFTKIYAKQVHRFLFSKKEKKNYIDSYSFHIKPTMHSIDTTPHR